MEYCQFGLTWSTNGNINLITKYALLQSSKEWVDDDLNTDGIAVSDSEILQLSKPAVDGGHCELRVSCKPYCKVSILGVSIVSEARTVECYSNVDGYVASIRGETVGSETPVNEEHKKLYHCHLKLPDLLSQVTFKFLGLGNDKGFRIHKLKFILLQGQEDNSLIRSRSGNIDIAKVKGYLHSMGDSVPDNAMELLQSVEQFQKNQMSGLQQIQNMFTGLKLGQSGDTGLEGLLSVVSKLGPITQAGQKLGTKSELQDEATVNKMPLNSVDNRLNGNLTPLESLARSLSQSEGHSELEGQSDDMMYRMLQNICGSVSKMRDIKSVQKQEDGRDAEVIKQVTDERNTQEQTRNEVENESSLCVTGMNSEELQTAIQQTVSHIFLSTEQRLKDYIDTSLSSLEDRLNQKFDSLVQQLVHNRQSSDVS